MLLGAVANWDDDASWGEFRRKYDPLLAACCRRMGLDAETTDDVIQETWIQVAGRMRSFVYDPRGSFRAWLWKVCRYEAIDALRGRDAEAMLALDDRDDPTAPGPPVDDPAGHTGDDGPGECGRAGRWLEARRREAERVQAEVRRRAAPETWEAFRLVCLELWTVNEAARELGMSAAGVYKATARMRARLRAEGAGFLDRAADRRRG